MPTSLRCAPAWTRRRHGDPRPPTPAGHPPHGPAPAGRTPVRKSTSLRWPLRPGAVTIITAHVTILRNALTCGMSYEP